MVGLLNTYHMQSVSPSSSGPNQTKPNLKRQRSTPGYSDDFIGRLSVHAVVRLLAVDRQPSVTVSGPTRGQDRW